MTKEAIPSKPSLDGKRGVSGVADPADSDLQRQKILIVDDRRENLLALSQVLTPLDLEIVEALSGNQALAATLDHRFALAIVDVMMPGMDGYELAGHLRGDAKTCNLPIIFLTAVYSEEERIFKGYEAGAVDYIIKPYNPVVLLSKVRVFLELDRAHQALAEKVAALTASEERYRTLVTTIPDIVYRIDRQGRFTYLNDAILSLGYTKEELLGVAFSSIMLPAEAQKASRQWVLPKCKGQNSGPAGAPKLFDERRTRQRRTMGLEVRLMPKTSDRTEPAALDNGSPDVVTAEINSSGIYAETADSRNPLFLGTVGVIRDITARKKAERELEHYRANLETLIHERVKEQACLYAVSEALAEPGKPLEDTLPRVAQRIPSGWRQAEKVGARIGINGHTVASEPFHESPWRLTHDIVVGGRVRGAVEVFHLEETPKADREPFVPEEKRLIQAIARLIAQAVERMEFETALKRSEQTLQAMFDSAQDGILLVNADTKGVVHANAAMGRMLDCNPQALGNPSLESGCLSDGISHLIKVFESQAHTGPGLTHDVQVRRGDGSLFPADVSAAPLKLDGQLHYLGIFRDITERKHIEAERARLQGWLVQAQKMEALGTLAGGIAHDFNNILSAILGNTELALDGADKKSMLANYLAEVRTAGIRAKDLVKQILAFARQTEEESRPVQVNLIVKEALKLLRASLPSSIDIKQDIESDSLILGEATQVHQILMNLCTNAAQAMELHGGVLHVVLKDILIDAALAGKHPGLKPGAYVHLSVADTGTGITPEHIHAIFDPYFTTKAPGEGTGLGLAIVHGIVKSYGGDIGVESNVGKGSKFTVYLPIIKKTPAVTAALPKALPTGCERILLIDDEVPIANVTSQILTNLGYRVTSHTSSLEALELFRSNPHDFDLVITDMTMPKMTGDELAGAMIKIRPEIPVILCTGYSKRISEEAASKIGIKKFVYKPISMADLAKTVRRVLDSKDRQARQSSLRRTCDEGT
jgi:PAS domain S-box-containing protein